MTPGAFDGTETRVLAADAVGIVEAARRLAAGELVAFPTDTVYGVGADLRRPEAVAALYQAKARPAEKAIPILVAEAGELRQVAAQVPAAAWRLAERFWPGALTIVVPAAAWLPQALTGGGPTVAVRMPDHAVVRELIQALGAPLATTSANLSGGSSPVTAQEVLLQLRGRIPLLLDGGPCPGGQPSTVVDLSVWPARILRSGPISAEEIQAALKRCR